MTAKPQLWSPAELALRRSSCRHELVRGPDIWDVPYVRTLFGLPNLPDGLPTGLPGLVTPPPLGLDEVAACSLCWQPMIWDHQGTWTTWGPVGPVDGLRRRDIPEVVEQVAQERAAWMRIHRPVRGRKKDQ